MLFSFLLVFFLIEFLVILGALVFALFFARPEVPLAGDGLEEMQPVVKPADAGEQSEVVDVAATLHSPDFHQRDIQTAPLPAPVFVPLHIPGGSADRHHIRMPIAIDVSHHQA